jgi:uncharacterized small protein (DUF1192 family)
VIRTCRFYLENQKDPLLDVLREYRNALRENNQRLVVLTDEIEQLKAAVSAGTGQNTATAAAAIRPHDESDSLQNDSQSLTLQQ